MKYQIPTIAQVIDLEGDMGMAFSAAQCVATCNES